MKITGNMMMAAASATGHTIHPEDLRKALEAALSASPAGAVKPLEWRHDGSRYYAYCGVTDTTWTAVNQEGRDRAEQTRAARIVSAIEPAGVGVETPPPSSHVMADVVSVRDGGNAITLHFAEIKSAKAFRDTFPAELVRPSPSDHVVWEETAPAREYVDTLKQEIERLRAIAIDMQAGYVEATERAEEAVKAANALQVEVDRLRAAPAPQSRASVPASLKGDEQ